MKVNLTILLFSTIITQNSIFAEQPDWNQWRGSNRDAVVTGKAWPNDLKASHFALKWSVKMGSSYSGPIMDGKTIYVTESSGDNEVVRALDRTTGKEKWVPNPRPDAIFRFITNAICLL